jgi:tRNA modification GTPase
MNWIACLTPPGQAAIATLAVHGPQAWQIVRPLFRPQSGASLPENPLSGRFWLGRLGSDVADEVVLTVNSSNSVELHCHGGREVVRFLLELFTQRGLALLSWSEHLLQTNADPLRGQAAVALAKAATTRTAGILLDQFQGALSVALAQVCEALQRDAVAEARSLLQNLIRHDALGRRLTTFWRVVIAGAPNVGKSSLVNALAGYQRSVVSPIPGTTRDVVTSRLAIDGWPVELADTAGLRIEADSLEGQGIEQAREQVASADWVLWVLDASMPPVWPAMQVRQLRLVLNKIDLPPAWDLTEAGDPIRVSARTGDGIGELCTALSGWLVSEPPPPGAAMPFTPELCDTLAEALRLLDARDAAGCTEVLERTQM